MANKLQLNIIVIVIICFSLLEPVGVGAMAPGTLLFRTSGNGQMLGYSGPLFTTEKGIIQAINSGHVAIYIGREQGEDYIVEATPAGVVKTPARYFVNRADNETLLGARLPLNLSSLQQAKVVAIAKNLAESNLGYDFDFHRQKGAWSGDWTCVGLTEKIYESANISNPFNIGALEYDQRYYALDITPDGFDNYSPPNREGDRFSREKEFSEISRRQNLLFPAPELIGFNAGLEHEGRRYLFLPYTQFLQPTLTPVPVDILVATSFSSTDIRTSPSGLAIGLRWSLINNPISSVKILAKEASELVSWVGGKLGVKDKGVEVVVEELNSQETEEKENLADQVPGVVINKSQGNSNLTASTTVALKTIKTEPVSSSTASSTKRSAVAVKSRSEATESKETPLNPTTPLVSPIYNVSATSSPPASKPAKLATTSPIKKDLDAQLEADAPRLARIEAIYATAGSDFIELYNPTAYDLDLAAAGYRLERSKTADDPSLMMRIGNVADGSYPGGTVIKAHGKYLIVRSGASTYYQTKAQAIATRTEFSWTGTGHTIYLGTAAISSSKDEDILEAVGFGAATFFQGSAPAPEITDQYILRRQGSSQNNSTDFRLEASDDPSLVWEENNHDDDDQVTLPTEEDDPVPEVVEPEVVPALIIKRIYATGGNDWLEITNPNNFTVDLLAHNYRLEKTKTAQDPSLMMRIGDVADGSYPGGTSILPGDTYLIVRDDASEYYRSLADAIATRTEFGWTGSGYTIYLASDPVSSSDDVDILEVVGFGNEAMYFLGSGPAPEISNGYALERVASSGNNASDFHLVLENDPDFEPEPEPDTSRFLSPTPITSPGLVNIWHFDECYGPGNWAVGRWDCAREVGYNIPGFQLALEPAVDLDSFSLAFYYSDRGQDARLDLRLLGPEGATAFLRLEENLATFEGLPNSQWRYYQAIPFDATWHQVVLVVNQASDYWAAYLDGQEIVREDFLANLPVMDRLEISSDMYPTLVDEVAIWHRPLSETEVSSYFLAAAPYAPLASRTGQAAPVLRYRWEFEEDSGSVALDSQQGTAMTVDPALWTGRKHNNYALATGLMAGASAELDLPLTGRDFSLAYWWQNTAYPKDGQAEITLWGGNENEARLLRLDTNYFRLNYSFNGLDSILVEGLGAGLPLDNLWHHIALVYDSYRYRLSLYVDGEEKLFKSHIWLPADYAFRRLEIGKSTWPAALDDLRVYSGALNAAEVRELYANTK